MTDKAPTYSSLGLLDDASGGRFRIIHKPAPTVVHAVPGWLADLARVPDEPPHDGTEEGPTYGHLDVSGERGKDGRTRGGDA
jgi:hypothetical protein